MGGTSRDRKGGILSVIIYCEPPPACSVTFFHRGADKEDVVHTYTMEYYSAIRKDEILPFVTIWMDLENIMLSKIYQSEKLRCI